MTIARKRCAANCSQPFSWQERHADQSGCWRDAALIAALGAALGDLHAKSGATVVCAVAARAFVLAAPVAVQLETGLVLFHNDTALAAGPNCRLSAPRTTAGVDKVCDCGTGLIGPKDRVLLVDWLEAGSQARAARELMTRNGASWAGVSTIVDRLL
jgi:adenine/guanine phosphoribosyltransferase-like PRPP-binding protein